MHKMWIDKFKKIFPDKQIKMDGKGNIIVKNIDSSLVYINPLDTDDLQKLRQEILILFMYWEKIKLAGAHPNV